VSLNGDFRQTIPSKSIEVWRRLYARFNLEPGPASVSPDVSKTIQPVTDVDRLLTTPEVRMVGTVSFNGALDVLVVPEDEIWALGAYSIFRTSGDRVLTQIDIRDVFGSKINLDTPASVSVTENIFGNKLRMGPGWLFRITVGGGTTNGSWTVETHVEVEQPT